MKKLIYVIGTLILFALIFQPLLSIDKPKNIMLLFDLKDYNKEIDSTIDSFFKKAVSSRDQLIVMTPAGKIYSYSSNILSESRKKVSQEIKDTLRKHTSVASSDYMNIYNQMLSIVDEIRDNTGSQDVKNLMAAYENNRNELKRTRKINEALLLEFAEVFKRSKEITGDTDNQIYLFFQRENRPIPDRDTMNRIRENSQLAFKAVEVFLGERSKTDFDAEKIAEELNEAGVTFNLIYISKKESSTQRYQLIDNAGDFYSAMSKIVEKTGGKKITTTQPKVIFEDL